MLRDLCAIFALFASAEEFQQECAKNGCKTATLRAAVRNCQKLNLLTGESIIAFESLPDLVDKASRSVADEEALHSCCIVNKNAIRIPCGIIIICHGGKAKSIHESVIPNTAQYSIRWRNPCASERAFNAPYTTRLEF